jgi:hypothetical protein
MKNKISFCGKENRDYAACLKDAVHFLLPKYFKLISRGVFCRSLKGF